MALRSLFLASALMLAACETTPTIRSDFDPSVDFSRFHTYKWVYTSAPQGMSSLTYQRVRDSIDRSLAARSFTQSENADFAVAFTLGARDRVEVSSYGSFAPFYPGWGRAYRWGWAPVYNSVDVRNVTDGSLAIDIYDAASRRPVWHGTATQQIDRGSNVDQATIDRAVDGVLARFPPGQNANNN